MTRGPSQKENARLVAAAPELRTSLANLLDHYLALANSGDCGNWNPEEEKEVIAARAALVEPKPEIPAADWRTQCQTGEELG